MQLTRFIAAAILAAPFVAAQSNGLGEAPTATGELISGHARPTGSPKQGGGFSGSAGGFAQASGFGGHHGSHSGHAHHTGSAHFSNFPQESGVAKASGFGGKGGHGQHSGSGFGGAHETGAHGSGFGGAAPTGSFAAQASDFPGFGGSESGSSAFAKHTGHQRRQKDASSKEFPTGTNPGGELHKPTGASSGFPSGFPTGAIPSGAFPSGGAIPSGFGGEHHHGSHGHALPTGAKFRNFEKPSGTASFEGGHARPTGGFGGERPSGSGFPSGARPTGAFPTGAFPSGSGFPSGAFPTGGFPSGSGFPSGARPTGDFPTGAFGGDFSGSAAFPEATAA